MSGEVEIAALAKAATSPAASATPADSYSTACGPVAEGGVAGSDGRRTVEEKPPGSP
jgi:hypothetical protein